MASRPDPRRALVAAMAAPRTGVWRRNPIFSFLWVLADMLLHMERRSEEQFAVTERLLHHIERMERTIMIDETKFAAVLTQMAADEEETAAGVQALLAKGDHATQDEIDSLTNKLSANAANLRNVASQFDAPAPTPTPDPSPAPSPQGKHGHK